MRISEAEEYLFDRMSAPRDAAFTHHKALEILDAEANPLEDHVAIGIDTNGLKILRRDLAFAERLVLALKQLSVELVIPGQCVSEFWNNHQGFATADWGQYRGQLAKLQSQIEANNVGGQFEKELTEIGKLVEQISAELKETKSPQYLALSRNLMSTIVEASQVPMVSRSRFAELARIRNASKNPPGFADEKLKGAASYGDFFVWCDFLLGALCVLSSSTSRQHFAWVTEDSKADWKTGPAGHPSLVEEFAWVTRKSLAVLSFEDLADLVNKVELPGNDDLPDTSDG